MRFVFALVALMFFSTPVQAFESGEIVSIKTYCETVDEAKKFLNSETFTRCFQSSERFPCIVVEDADVVRNIVVASCIPHPDAVDALELPTVIYSFYPLRGSEA